jgi:heme A synthase
MTNDNALLTKRYCYLLVAASVMTFLLIALGSIVCITESGLGCPDWPGCYGKIVPPRKLSSIIEYTHRLSAALASPLVIAAAIVGWRRYRALRWVSRSLVFAILCMFTAGAFGALAVLRGIPPIAAALDLASALMALTLVLTATAIAISRYQDPALPDKLSFHSPFARLSLWTLAAAFIVLVSGVLAAESGSLVRCLGWPLYNEWFTPVDLRGWLFMARYLVGGIASALIVALVARAWRTQPERTPARRAATLVGVLFLAEIIIGLLGLMSDSSLLLVLYVALAAALWAGLVILTVLAGLAS